MPDEEIIEVSPGEAIESPDISDDVSGDTTIDIVPSISPDLGTDVSSEALMTPSPAADESIDEYVEDQPVGYTVIDNIVYDSDGNIVTYLGVSPSPSPTDLIENDLTVSSDLQEFESSSYPVNLYEYQILERLNNIQYGVWILVCISFLGLFLGRKK